jgi:hypothetical protein
LLEVTIAWTEQLKEAKELINQIISELSGELGGVLRNNFNAFG